MSSELREACIAAVQRAEGPMTAAQIATAALGGKKPSTKVSTQVAEILSSPGHPSIHEWPKFGVSRMYANRPFRTAVEEAFLKALDTGPLTVPKAANPVSKLLKKVAEKRAATELKLVAPQLAAAKRILQVAVNRQAVVYLSFDYLHGLIPNKPTERSSLGDSILTVVERLQSGPGNYVRIDHLRKAPELRAPFDEEAIALADAGKLVLARYDGPRPLPEDEKWNYIIDKQGDIFIGVALPRGERVNA